MVFLLGFKVIELHPISVTAIQNFFFSQYIIPSSKLEKSSNLLSLIHFPKISRTVLVDFYLDNDPFSVISEN